MSSVSCNLGLPSPRESPSPSEWRMAGEEKRRAEAAAPRARRFRGARSSGSMLLLLNVSMLALAGGAALKSDDGQLCRGLNNSGANAPAETDWFFAAKRGVFTHYLNGLQNSFGSNSQGKNSTWSRCVDEFSAEAYAESAAATGAHYAVITMMQGSNNLLGPNARYNQLTGNTPSGACSKRDLVLDLHAALAKRGLHLLLYWTGDGPHEDAQASAGMGLPGCPGTDPGGMKCRKNIPELFTQRWGSVLQEYAVRYGDKVKGWWVDGCYEYFNYTDAKLKSYHDAIRKGNPRAMMAFNGGANYFPIGDCPICKSLTGPMNKCYSRWNDITNGEADWGMPFNPVGPFKDIPTSRNAGGQQWHTLGFIGKTWAAECNGTCRYTAAQFRDYSRKVAAGGGVLTVDLQLLRNGSMNAQQVALLKTAWKGLKTDDAVPVVVNSSRVVQRTADSLVGLVFDGYTTDQGDDLRTNAWRYSNWVEANMSEPIFRSWMAALAEPSGGDLIVRIGGGPQDSVVFSGDANCSFSKMVNKGQGCNSSQFDYNSGNCVVLTPQHLDGMLDLCAATGCKLVFGLNAMYGACCAGDLLDSCPFASTTCKGDARLGSGCCKDSELLRTMFGTGHCGTADVSTNKTACQPWDSSNALAILKHAHARPKTHWPFGFELGNELNPAAFQARNGDELVAMFLKLSSMIDEVWSDTSKAERPKLIGPDNDFGPGHYHAASALNATGMQTMAQILHAWTYHEYGGGGEIRRASQYAGVPSSVPSKLLQEYAPDLELWLGEGGGSGCTSGPLPQPPAPSPMLSNTHQDIFWYLSALGELAKSGKKRMLRETIAGGWYGLTNLTFQQDATVPPAVSPDFYAALLFTRLLGPTVLMASLSTSSPKLAAYAHCARDNKSTTLLLLNMDETKAASIVLQVSGATASAPHEIYRLSPGADLHSIKLNGKELALGTKGDLRGRLPPLPPVSGSGALLLAPLDVAFVVVPTSACG